MNRLAIITTHPIQYNAPLFAYLAKSGSFEIKVFYTWGQSQALIYDPLFSSHRTWDIPLLEGYDYTFTNNIASDPGSHHFFGIDNPSLISDVESFYPDAILIFGWAFKSHLKVLRYFKGKVPILFRGDSINHYHLAIFNVRQFLRKLFLKWVYQHIDYALYVGEKNKEYYAEAGVKSWQLIFAPHAVDNERFCQVPFLDNNNETSIRNKYAVPESDIVYLYVGKLYALKSVDLLIDAFVRLDHKKSRLLIVGSGEMEESLKQKARENNRIVFLGFVNQSEMPAIYHSADVVVLPSKSETWGLSVNEAMACGKAVIVSDKCGCAQDLVSEGVNGYIFPSGNVTELTTAMVNIVNGDAYQAMGQKSLEMIAKYNYQSFLEALQSITLKHED